MNHVDLQQYHLNDDDKIDALISTLIIERARWSWYEQSRESIARNAALAGVPYEVIQKITGLCIETIRDLR